MTTPLWCPASDLIHGLDREKVQITHESSLFSVVPLRGTIPITFQVRNQMEEPGRWTFRFRCAQGWDQQKQTLSERVVTVPAKSAKTVRWEILVFSTTEFTSSQQQTLRVSVSGPGSPGGVEQQLDSTFYNAGSGVKLVAVSPALTVTRDNWKYSEFEAEISAQNLPLLLTHFDPEALPDRVSGLSGMDILMLSDAEWKDLQARHGLIDEWVAGGGQLLILSDSPAEPQTIGLGSVRSISPMQTDPFIAMLQRTPAIQSTLADPDAFTRKQWELFSSVPEIQQSFGWVMLTVLVIACLLGPLNIWVSFRKRNSLQVIWSTPLISLVLSSLVALGIIFSDGFGGKGERALRVLLIPDLGVELSVQEQVSRTGVLLKNHFELPEGTEIYQVKTDKRRGRSRVQYTQLAGGGWAGDWFQNRSVQAQVLRRSRRSRAEVILKSGTDAPTVVSTVDAVFTRLLLRDSEGQCWIAQGVQPGREAPLSRISDREAENDFADLRTRNKNLFPGEEALRRRAWFYGESVEKDDYIPTLGSVKWSDRPVWFMGPCRMEGGR
ncbi:MAG: hypothetical protein ACO3N7_09860 [Kiritimatiellia bacterium]